jgi:AcrR family transcriptional regulator
MEKFFNLPAKKQAVIIDAALIAFGDNGYRKASISDIAASAGISKAMVFHYFGTKKDLYLYLVSYCGEMITSEVTRKFDSSISDFFDRIIQASDIEIAVIRKHPGIITFLKSMYFETNEEVAEDIKKLLSQGDDFRNKLAFDGMDTSKFKKEADLKLVMKMLLWMADGFMNEIKGMPDSAFDIYCNEFYGCMKLMKNSLYKEEFLS